MKRLFKVSKRLSLFLLTTFVFLACDKDFNSIESDVLGEDNTNFNASNTNLNILAYNKKLDALQINNLGSTLLGFYNDPIYGQTTASLITQLTPTIENPNFGTNAVIDSVILDIPYYSRTTGQIDDTNTPEYTISDSIYGDEDAPIKLTIYRTNYFLGNANDGTRYFSNANHTENSFLRENTTVDIEDQIIMPNPIKEITFTPSNKAIKLTAEVNDVTTTTSYIPALRIDLAESTAEKAEWKTLILDKNGSEDLRNASYFQNYIRSLYFKAEAVGGNGQMILLNTMSSDSKITVHYTKDIEGSDPVERDQGTYVLNLTGTQINTFINNYNITLPEKDLISGNEKLYLKGGGTMAVVDLFNGLVDCEETNTEETALDCFKKTYRQLNEDGYVLKSGEKVEGEYITKNGRYVLKRLINEARLVVYEDDESIDINDEKHIYDRIYAYTLENNSPTFDYLVDRNEDLSDPKNSKNSSLGQRILYEDEDGEKHYKYKIKITEHLNNILVNNSTNTKLGLVLSNNVNVTRNSEILESNDAVTAVPTASILSPRGTVLYGSHASIPKNRKMIVNIYLSEPKE